MALVRTATNSGIVASGGTLTLTLPGATTAGHGLIVLVATAGSSVSPTVAGITLGGSADHFAARQSSGVASADACVLATWDDLNCAGGQTAVAITITGGTGTFGVMATVWERDDLPSASAFDVGKGQAGTGSASWTSTATVTTAQAGEVWVGAICADAASAQTLTGPASPWANTTQVNLTVGSFVYSWMAGWQAVSATGTATYAGTSSTTPEYVAVVATYKAAPSASLLPQQIRMRRAGLPTRLAGREAGAVYGR